jgi:hypothetical protein
VQQCNNFGLGSEALDAITCCASKLKKLHLLEMRCHASNHSLACLGALTQVRFEAPSSWEACIPWRSNSGSAHQWAVVAVSLLMQYKLLVEHR